MQSMTECLLHNGQLTLRTDIKLFGHCRWKTVSKYDFKQYIRSYEYLTEEGSFGNDQLIN